MKPIPLVLLLCVPAIAGPDAWLTDYEKAVEASQKTGKPVLLDFTGSDWCGYCKKLDAEVFRTDEFEKWAKKNVILLMVDFPRGRKLDADVARQNNELKARFKVSGYPTLVFMDADGIELGRSVGYRPGTGAEGWIEDASAKLKAGRAAEGEAADPWLTDWKQAVERAKKERKPILADFTGSDWCGWCMKLNEEVFSKDEFKEWAEKNVILLEVDFPREKPQPEALRKQNQELKSKYQIRGYPTILFLDAKGKVLGRSGYMPGGPEAWIKDAKKKIG